MEKKFDGRQHDTFINDEFGQTGKLHFKSPKAIEFERYKQDCRKRAIEMAHADFHSGKLSLGATIKTAADEYYEWLISIPE